jgi:F-type H+-transporting ATPase subunit gamma
MAGGQERLLRRRIRSVQSTRKITRAMELIAASRIVRAQQAISAARPYVNQMREVITNLADTPEAAHHPLFRQPESVRTAAMIVVTADRGLAGAYNSSVLRAAERTLAGHRSRGEDVMLVTIGRKADSHFRYRNRPPAEAITGISDRPGFADARRVVRAVMEAYTDGEVDQIQLVYTRFKSMGSQEVTLRQLVPLEDARREDAGDGSQVDYEYEPDPGEILDRLLPRWLEAEVFAALLESAASEHAARQRAMKAATDNADELTKTLTRRMNRARQDTITTEIMEIVGGAEALGAGASSDGAGGYHEVYVPQESA